MTVNNLAKITEIYQRPLLELVAEAFAVHREHHPINEIQKSTLLSIKTGKCPEDCKYCSQSAHYKTDLESHGLLSEDKILKAAEEAKKSGSTRFAWGVGDEVKDGAEFDQVLKMVRKVKELGMETCVTLGMLNQDQANRLKAAGLDYYNHNIDTSPEYYEKVVTTRSYAERIDTIEQVRSAGINVCTGGILGMGETREDRISFINQLYSMSTPPESITINRLVPIKGTPLQDTPVLDEIELVRVIATARILMPKSYIRLSAGRETMGDGLQALCFMSGANSLFAGERLLTTKNRGAKDQDLFEKIGVVAQSLEGLQTEQSSF